MGLYPLCACPDWSHIEADLNDLSGRLVSLVLVTDPFYPPPVDELSRLFPERSERFKDHCIVDLSVPYERRTSEHHRRYARSARRDLRVERCAATEAVVDDWIALYDDLIARHAITGLTRFSPDIFRLQLALHDMLVFRACDGDGASAMALFIRDGDQAYYHLGASSPRGYASRASFGIFAQAFECLAELGVRRVDLGAGPSTPGPERDGLLRFKRGWSTHLLPTWLCGRVLDRTAYDSEIVLRGLSRTQRYFPAYRALGVP
jgi:hypothetical protein